MEEVKEWLRGLGLNEYSQSFEEAGFDSMPVLQEMTVDEIKSEIPNMKKGHEIALKKGLAKLIDAANTTVVAPITGRTSKIQKNEVANENEVIKQVLAFNECSQLLQDIPTSVCLMGHLIMIAGAKDFELKAPACGFQYLKYTESFNACIVQVSNQAWKAFNKANTNMDKISLHSIRVRKYIKDSTEIIFEGTKDDVSDILPDIITSMKDTNAECVKLSTETEKQFTTLMDVISELLETVVCKKGQNEKDFKEREKALLKAKSDKEELEKQKEDAERQSIEMAKAYRECSEQCKKAFETKSTDKLFSILKTCGTVIAAVALAPVAPIAAVVALGTLGVASVTSAAVKTTKIKAAVEQRNEVLDRMDKANEERKRASEELNKVIFQIKTCDLEKIDFDEIRKTLVQGLEAIGKIRIQWAQLVRFFQDVSTRVNSLTWELGDLQKSLKIGQDRSMKDITLSDVHTKLISTQAQAAFSIADVTFHLSSLYVEVSRDYLMKPLAALGELTAINYQQDKPLYERTMSGLTSQCTAAQNGISGVISRRVDKYFEASNLRLAEAEDVMDVDEN